MRIGIDVQATRGQRTGIGVYADRLLRALPRVAPHHEYVPLSWEREGELRTDQRLRWQQWLLPRRARAAGVDLLHVPGFDAPRWRPCPVVLTVHDLIGLLFPEQLPPISRLYWAGWLPRSLRWADHLIADSSHTARDLERRLGIPPERITVIPLGVDERFHPEIPPEAREAARRKYGLAFPVILYVGTLGPRKGLDTLVAAFGRIADRIPHHLVLVGKPGWWVDRLLREIRALGLTERVHLLGYVPEEDLPALYRLADVFAYPSRYEGFGLPPLEAMACGTPVVCADAASLPEVVGDAALRVPPGDLEAWAAALLRILEDESLRRRLQVEGPARARRFTWEETARRTVRVYEQVAGR